MKKIVDNIKLHFIFFIGYFIKGNIEKDKKYLKILYRHCMKKKCNINNPVTYNEKLQWLKLHERKEYYTRLVDKYEVKNIVAEKIGEEYLIKTLGVWENFDEIDFDKLPNQFVLKCTHDSGGIVICQDKEKLDIRKARKKINHCLHRNYYLNHREWPYKNIKPKIIAEEYFVDESGKELKDYKFFCFNGKARILFVATDRPIDTKFDFFDMEFRHLPIINGHPNSSNPISKPKNFDKMIEIAEKLSSGIPHVRVDLYNVNGKIKFGEMTFYHWSGLVPFEPEEWDYKLGEWLELPKNMEESNNE